MKYIITESSLNRFINRYLDDLELTSESDNLEIFVSRIGNEYSGAFNYFYDEEILFIDPDIVSMVSGLFSMDIGQAMEGIAVWFEDKFNVTVLSTREWDW
jgi:hypothetical protein